MEFLKGFIKKGVEVTFESVSLWGPWYLKSLMRPTKAPKAQKETNFVEF